MENLSDCPVTFQKETGDVQNSFWMVSLVVDKPQDRDLLRNALESNGVETRPLFYPVHTMPMYFKKLSPIPHC